MSNYPLKQRLPNTQVKIFFFCLLFPAMLFTQNNTSMDHELIDMMNNINPQPTAISFKNNILVNNNGGHIQGIQYLKYKIIISYLEVQTPILIIA